MKKKIISGVLLALNICMVIAIIVLIIKIAARGPKPPEPVVSQNDLAVSANSVSQNIPTPKPQEAERVLVAIPNVTNSVNVRTGPSTDYERIGSAYSDCEYEVIEIQSNGWTKLYYEDETIGYISSEFLIYKYKLVFSEDTCTYEDVTEEELAEYMTE